MRDIITKKRRLSLAGRKPRIIPASNSFVLIATGIVVTTFWVWYMNRMGEWSSKKAAVIFIYLNKNMCTRKEAIESNENVSFTNITNLKNTMDK